MSDSGLAGVRGVMLAPLQRGNALEETVARLVQTIRLGVVAPGESLPSERELAARFGVSRDTVREAIRELGDAGFLEARRGRYGGTFIADPLPQPEHPVEVSAAELADVLALRAVLESGAARAAAARALTATERAALSEWHRASAVAGADDYRRCDTMLHLTIVELAGIPSLIALVAANRAQVNEWLDTFPLLPRNIEHSNAQHDAVVSAILAGDADAAAAAMAEHLAGSESLLRGFLG